MALWGKLWEAARPCLWLLPGLRGGAVHDSLLFRTVHLVANSTATPGHLSGKLGERVEAFIGQDVAGWAHIGWDQELSASLAFLSSLEPTFFLEPCFSISAFPQQPLSISNLSRANCGMTPQLGALFSPWTVRCFVQPLSHSGCGALAGTLTPCSSVQFNHDLTGFQLLSLLLFWHSGSTPAPLIAWYHVASWPMLPGSFLVSSVSCHWVRSWSASTSPLCSAFIPPVLLYLLSLTFRCFLVMGGFLSWECATQGFLCWTPAIQLCFPWEVSRISSLVAIFLRFS